MWTQPNVHKIASREANMDDKRSILYSFLRRIRWWYSRGPVPSKNDPKKMQNQILFQNFKKSKIFKNSSISSISSFPNFSKFEKSTNPKIKKKFKKFKKTFYSKEKKNKNSKTSKTYIFLKKEEYTETCCRRKIKK